MGEHQRDAARFSYADRRYPAGSGSDRMPMTRFPNADAGREARAADAVRGIWAGAVGHLFRGRFGNHTATFNFVDAQVAAEPSTPSSWRPPEATWGRFLEPVPPLIITVSSR